MNIKGYFKSKFSKERVSKFFDKEGFYIVLFLCVCIVAITAVWVSRNGVKNDNSQNLGGVKENKTEVSTPSKETSTQNNANQEPKLTVTEQAKVSKEQGKGTEPKKETKITPTKASTVPSSIALDSPIKDGLLEANILRDYSPTELICFKNLNEWRTHPGIDIKASEGAEVLAVYSGKVIDVRNDNSLGWTVVVDHNNGYKSIYANLDEVTDVKKNQSLKKGQKIGIVGKSSLTEYTASDEGDTVSHLHFELLKKGAKTYENVDPKKYLTMQK